MKAFTKVLTCLSLLLPVVSWADFSLKDFEGDFVSYFDSPGVETYVLQSTIKKNGKSKINWSSSTINVGADTFITLSNNNGTGPSLRSEMFLTDTRYGTGVSIAIDDTTKTYTVLDFVAYSTNPRYKVTNILFNVNTQQVSPVAPPTPVTDPAAVALIASLNTQGYTQGPTTTIAVSHSIRQEVSCK